MDICALCDEKITTNFHRESQLCHECWQQETVSDDELEDINNFEYEQNN